MLFGSTENKRKASRYGVGQSCRIDGGKSSKELIVDIVYCGGWVIGDAAGLSGFEVKGRALLYYAYFPPGRRKNSSGKAALASSSDA
jgi:hypothetical protein